MDLLVWSRRGPVDPLLWRSLRTRILRVAGAAQRFGAPPGHLARGIRGGAGQDLGPLGMAHPGDPRILWAAAPPPPPVTRRRLLFPPLGGADTSDATSLGSCRSEPSGEARSPSAPRTRVGSGLPSRPCGRRAKRASRRAVPEAPVSWGRQAATAAKSLHCSFIRAARSTRRRARALPESLVQAAGADPFDLSLLPSSPSPPLPTPPLVRTGFITITIFPPLCRFDGGMCEGGGRSGRQRILGGSVGSVRVALTLPF